MVMIFNFFSLVLRTSDSTIFVNGQKLVFVNHLIIRVPNLRLYNIVLVFFFFFPSCGHVT